MQTCLYTVGLLVLRAAKLFYNNTVNGMASVLKNIAMRKPDVATDSASATGCHDSDIHCHNSDIHCHDSDIHCHYTVC